MTEEQLKRRVFSVVVILMSIFSIALICRFGLRSEEWYTSIKDFSSLFLGIGGAYLAFCFQRRQAFISSLKDLWKEMVTSRIAILRYMDLIEPGIADFNVTYEQISKTVDLVRSVYPNVGEDRKSVGLYPFQPLREMLHSLERLNPKDPQSFVETEREVVDQAWDALRWSFLPEFSRPPATEPIVEYSAADPRRKTKRAEVAGQIPERR